MSRVISITFEDDDVSMLDRWKGDRMLDYAKTVRKSIGVMRRLERHVDDGFTRMVLINAKGERREFDDIREFVPERKD